VVGRELGAMDGCPSLPIAPSRRDEAGLDYSCLCGSVDGNREPGSHVFEPPPALLLTPPASVPTALLQPDGGPTPDPPRLWYRL